MEQPKDNQRQGNMGMMDESLLCSETTNAGDPCPAPRMSNSTYCFMHDPERAEEAVAARSAGGEAGGRKRKYAPGTKVSIDSLEDVLEGLGETIGNLKEMDLTVDVCRTLIRAWQVAAQCFTEREDREQLQAEMDELRKALGLVGE